MIKKLSIVATFIMAMVSTYVQASPMFATSSIPNSSPMKVSSAFHSQSFNVELTILTSCKVSRKNYVEKDEVIIKVTSQCSYGGDVYLDLTEVNNNNNILNNLSLHQDYSLKVQHNEINIERVIVKKLSKENIISNKDLLLTINY